jgi:phage tail-like protein
MPARELHEAFNFTVQVEGFPEGTHFAQCSEISVDIEEITYLEAGSVVPVKDPGAIGFPPVTLTRGASRSKAFFSWASDVILAAVPPVAYPFRKEVQVFQRDRRKRIVLIYTLHKAFPISFSAGAWDNAADQVVIQSLQLAYEYFTLKVRTNADSRIGTSL